MHPTRPSTTAIAVSMWRGLARDPVDPARPLDPVAASLLPPPAALAVRCLWTPLRSAALRRVHNAVWAGLPEHIDLRTRHIDGVLRAALADGCRQVVILGAGLDARAERMAELDGIDVWEVDHPNTQAYKREALTRFATRHGRVRWVGVDFTVDDLGARLDAEGFDAGVPACWIWEGVTPYLPPDAIDGTLAVVGARSAPGSWMVMSYCRPELISLPGWMHATGHRLFHLLREPLLGVMRAEEASRRLEAAGFVVEADTGAAAWAAACGRPLRIAIEERVIVGRVPAGRG